MTEPTIPGLSKAMFHTFGCKLNFAETSTIAKMMEQKGIRRIEEGETPDVIVVNTCSVTELADKKCRQTVRSFHRRYPKAIIVITGCYAQLKSEEAASLPGVAIVAGSNQKRLITQYLEQWAANSLPIANVPAGKDLSSFEPSCSRGDRTRYFLKVQDGCDYWCTYCTIPKARGRSRSGTIPELVAQAQAAAAEGGKEIVITGVNIGDFGKGRDDDFFELIKALDQVEGIERYRISSIEPNLLTDEMIHWCATEAKRFMPHFHIPLQCGSNEVLKLMHRHYDTSLFAHKISMIRQEMPHAFIGVDLIVGARGETPELFAESKTFVESLPISRLHVFPYSERPGTKALEIPYIVSPQDKQLRMKEMLKISDYKLAAFSKQFLGMVRPVLLEHALHGAEGHKRMSGFTDNYLRVNVEANPALDNKIVNIRLDSLDPSSLEFNGTIAQP